MVIQNEYKLPTNTLLNKFSLGIVDVSLENRGIYTCKGHIDSEGRYPFYANVHFIIKGTTVFRQFYIMFQNCRNYMHVGRCCCFAV